MKFQLSHKSSKISQKPIDIFPKLKKIIEINKICADCDSDKPVWASVNLGIHKKKKTKKK